MEGAQKKVLIVDDSEFVHRICRVTLAKFKDCAVLDAMNGFEGIEVLSREGAVDLILLDLNMQVMNGFEFMEKLKGISRWRKIPIIVISSEKKDEDKDKALKLGAWAYVEKAKPEALQGLIEHALGGKSH